MIRWLVSCCLFVLVSTNAWAEQPGYEIYEPGPPKVAVSVHPGTTKIYGPQPVLGGPVPGINIRAMRGETESFQIIIHNVADSGSLENVTVTATGPFECHPYDNKSTLPCKQGTLVPTKNVTFFLQHRIRIEKPSPCDTFFSKDCGGHEIFQRTPGDYPDPLIPFYDPYDPTHPPVANLFDIPQGDYAAVWVDIKVPRNIAHGRLWSHFRVWVDGEQQPFTIPVSLWIYDIELPASPSITTSYNMGVSRLWDYHGGADGDPVRRKKVYDNYDRMLHQHRMALRNYADPIRFQFDELGQLIPPDFAAWDAQVQPRLTGGFYTDDGGEVKRFNLDMFRPGGSMMGLSEGEFIQAAKAMIDHLDEKGWLSRVYLYSLDEPWLPEHWADGAFDKIRYTVGLLEQASTAWTSLVMVTGPWLEALHDVVGIWVPQVPLYGDVFYPPGSWAGRDKYDELRAQGKEVWFYVCNGSYPGVLGYDLDSKIGWEPRLLKWGSWYEKATGFLYWRVNYWLDPDPWAVVGDWEKYGEQFTRNGDGILLYPGDHDGVKVGQGSPDWVKMDGPVVSFRMKQIRDGLEDWELFLIAEQMGFPNFARNQVKRAFRSFGQVLTPGFDFKNPPFALDDEILHEARRTILERLHAELHPYTPPIPVIKPDKVEPAPDVTGSEEIWTPEVMSDLWGAPDSGPRDVFQSGELSPDTTGRRSSSCQAGHRSTAPGPSLYLVLLLLVLFRVAGRRRNPEVNLSAGTTPGGP
jgi:hypothetical protein